MWEAHSDVIKAVQYITATDEPLVFTAGLDRMACIWGLDGSPRGRLIQGYMMKTNYFWDFPLRRHQQAHAERQDVAMGRLRTVRAERLQDRTYCRQAANAVRRIADQTTCLGFAGASLIGLAPDVPTGVSNAEHTRPKQYVTAK